MPLITRITEQKRRPNRRNVFLDGQFAFGCNVNVIAAFRLREGLALTDEQVQQIVQGEVRQECFDTAMRYLQARMHSRAELRRKLMRREYGEPVIDGVLDDLQRLGYVDDARFAEARAQDAVERRHHGRRRAWQELQKAGISPTTAQQALDAVYGRHDPVAAARALAEKQAPRLRKLDPHVARRRLVGMLQRRGFDYDEIAPVVADVLGPADDA